MAFDSKAKEIIYKSSLSVFLLVYIIYSSPFLSSLFEGNNYLKYLTQKDDGIIIPVIRSLVYAIIQSFFTILIALFFSTAAVRISILSIKGLLMSLLLIPTILGSISVAFVWKMLIIDSDFAFNNSYNTFLTLGFIQFWQYGTLCTYLFWLNQQGIFQSIWDYAKANHLSSFEKIKDIILPKQRNLFILLYILCFIFSYYEESKIHFIFKASRGNNTELINQWLNRTYQSDLLSSNAIALHNLSQFGFISILAALIGLIISVLFIYIVYSKLIENRISLKFDVHKTNLFGNISIVSFSLFVVVPIVFVFVKQATNFKLEIDKLLFPLFLTFIASFIATCIAINFGILARITFSKFLSNFNFRSLAFLITLFLMCLIPPTLVFVTGFKWMQIIGYLSDNTIYVSWIIGHIIMVFPLLTSFIIITHFKIKNDIINFLDVHRLNFFEKTRDLFLLPFSADYLLTFILAFSLIWNEGVINNILSDVISSFATELNKTVNGKSVDYATGMNYLFVSLLLAIMSVLLWNSILKKYQKQN